MSADETERRLQRSWRTNAAAWTRAVREQRIPSRRAGTDAAVLDAVLATGARRILDVGCGEGWLARALAAHGREVVGIDASAELIAAANELGGARFETLSYADLDAHAAGLGRFDAAVCNFALLGEDLGAPLRALGRVLQPGGRLVVQTVHPWIACGDAPYIDGWRLETFAGFGEGFDAPMPWYFRTLASWLAAVAANGYLVERVVEPVDAASGRPLSLLLQAALQKRTSPA
ncbi:class I SAM-dependent methyltransferase [Dokdonella sp.]|uniref:class I SAM-dependent methyltransferase n=1 Tax=Dokdonella sp. TaxID=2291710 RepID=UPI001B07292F|nr:class I SAM-dependent methyltransferase [Dokdonella sp.]MBO9663810.1 class I SAM-dependent methyltransferase [Dokdonella sp.]